MKRTAAAIAVTLALVLPAQSDAQVVLKGSDLTESALIDALTPRAGTRNLAREPSRAASQNPAASILITFETNSTELTSQAKDQLDTVGRALASNRLSEFTFLLEGHADVVFGSRFKGAHAQRVLEIQHHYVDVPVELEMLEPVVDQYQVVGFPAGDVPHGRFQRFFGVVIIPGCLAHQEGGIGKD